jgi:PAS domain S-box-containing protein
MEHNGNKKTKVKTEVSESVRKQSEYLKSLVQERTSDLVNTNKALQAEIDERKQVEEELRESEEQFRATFNQAGVGIGHLTPDGRWIRINRKYCDIVGYSEEKLKTMTIGDITHPDDLEASMKNFRLLQEGKIENYSLEKRYIHKNGSIVWVNLTASMVKDAFGNPRFAVGVIEDITPRKHAEESLCLSEARYRALYNDVPIMIFTVDADFMILSANQSCAGQLGYTVKELEGRSALEVFHEEDRPSVAEQLRKCLRNPNQVYKWQFRKIHRDGGVVWVEETAQALYDLSSEINILVVCQDISERKRADEEIGILNRKLKARASDLESANRELEAFNYSVAHDLRKPLTVINILCQTLEEMCGDNLNDECKGYVRESYNCTLRMNGLIEALLNFSRLAHIELHREKVDLSAMARVEAAELRVSEPTRRVDFRIEEGLIVNGDPQLLRVVLDNLFGNSWKYTNEREEAVIEFNAEEIDGKPAYFVRDNGCGFDMSDVDKLFTPFMRLSGVEEWRGLGIGLATVERIIRRHGGRVWAEGEPGRGATIFFTLPEEVL